MARSTPRRRYESHLEIALFALRRAVDAASDGNMESEVEDAIAIMREVVRLAEDSILMR